MPAGWVDDGDSFGSGNTAQRTQEMDDKTHDKTPSNYDEMDEIQAYEEQFIQHQDKTSHRYAQSGEEEWRKRGQDGHFHQQGQEGEGGEEGWTDDSFVPHQFQDQRKHQQTQQQPYRQKEGDEQMFDEFGNPIDRSTPFAEEQPGMKHPTHIQTHHEGQFEIEGHGQFENLSESGQFEFDEQGHVQVVDGHNQQQQHNQDHWQLDHTAADQDIHSKEHWQDQEHSDQDIAHQQQDEHWQHHHAENMHQDVHNQQDEQWQEGEGKHASRCAQPTRRTMARGR